MVEVTALLCGREKRRDGGDGKKRRRKRKAKPAGESVKCVWARRQGGQCELEKRRGVACSFAPFCPFSLMTKYLLNAIFYPMYLNNMGEYMLCE